MLKMLSFLLTLASVLQIPASPASAQEVPASRKLVVAGGGSLPNSVYEKFLELAGERPKLVVIPTASNTEPDAKALTRIWNERGFESVKILHTRDRSQANSASFVEPLNDATAVWFGGGSQSKIAEAYCDTAVQDALFGLLERGGVIGGTSAGAAVQSELMIASGRIEPTLKTGLGLLPECIIDQHFLARDRIRRSIAAVKANPEKIGIGIDEGTALVVIGDETIVLGRSFVLRIESRDAGLDIRSHGRGDRVPLSLGESSRLK